MYFFKLFFLVISLFIFNIHAENWDFEKTRYDDGYKYSSFVFSNNYNDFFSVYCSEVSDSVYFLINFKDETLFNEEESFVNIYFDDDRTNEHVLVADYSKGSIFFDKSSFFIGHNNTYSFEDFINYIKKSKKITFLTKINKRRTFDFKLKNSFNSLNKLSQHCDIWFFIFLVYNINTTTKNIMAKVQHRKNENFEKLLRRFKRACDDDKIIFEARKREFFEKNSEKNRKKRKSAIKRNQKEQLKNQKKKKLY